MAYMQCQPPTDSEAFQYILHQRMMQAESNQKVYSNDKQRLLYFMFAHIYIKLLNNGKEYRERERLVVCSLTINLLQHHSM